VFITASEFFLINATSSLPERREEIVDDLWLGRQVFEALVWGYEGLGVGDGGCMIMMDHYEI
jgi:hypothetical protein